MMKLFWTEAGYATFRVENGRFTRDAGFESAVMMQLSCDRRDDNHPRGRRGFWGDDDTLTGSYLWKLDDAKQNVQTARLARQYAEDSVDWMKSRGMLDGLNASSEFCPGDMILIRARLNRPEGLPEAWGDAWDRMQGGEVKSGT